MSIHEGLPRTKPTLVTVPGQRGKSAVCPFSELPACPLDRCPHQANERRPRARPPTGRRRPRRRSQQGYIAPRPRTEEARCSCRQCCAGQEESAFASGLPAVPNEAIPDGNRHTIRPSKYGYRTYGELCNDRQTLGFGRLCRIIAEIGDEARSGWRQRRIRSGPLRLRGLGDGPEVPSSNAWRAAGGAEGGKCERSETCSSTSQVSDSAMTTSSQGAGMARGLGGQSRKT